MENRRRVHCTFGVRLGSWLCENTSARDRDSITVSQRLLLSARRVASRSYFGGFEKDSSRRFSDFCVFTQLDVGGTSAIGRVSRVSPVHTAIRNCTRDEDAMGQAARVWHLRRCSTNRRSTPCRNLLMRASPSPPSSRITRAAPRPPHPPGWRRTDDGRCRARRAPPRRCGAGISRDRAAARSGCSLVRARCRIFPYERKSSKIAVARRRTPRHMRNDDRGTLLA